MTILVLLLFFHATATAMVFLALGQFGRALVAFRRWRDSVRRTEAASSQRR